MTAPRKTAQLDHEIDEALARPRAARGSGRLFVKEIAAAKRDGVVPVNPAGYSQLRMWLRERAEAGEMAVKAIDGAYEAIIAAGASGASGKKRRHHSSISSIVESKPRTLSTKFSVVRRPDRETQTSDDHPGTSPPHQSALSIGREREGWKPLYWKRVLVEYKKETPKRGGLGNTIDLSLWIMHAPDARTPFTRVDWPDPLDVRGAGKFARQLVEDGGAQFVEVNARARRPYSKEEAIYTLANFAKAP